MVLIAITGSLLAAWANLWPTLAAAAEILPTAATVTADTAPPGSPARPSSERSERWEAPVGAIDPATRFDPPPLPWLPGHRGVDLASSAGHAVVAAGSGTVVFAGNLAGRGVVSIEHSGGLRTTYEPVDPVVSRGEAVAAGQVIGHLAAGHASCPTAACLHLGLKRGPAYLDPLLLFGFGQVRLLPRPDGEAP